MVLNLTLCVRTTLRHCAINSFIVAHLCIRWCWLSHEFFVYLFLWLEEFLFVFIMLACGSNVVRLCAFSPVTSNSRVKSAGMPFVCVCLCCSELLCYVLARRFHVCVCGISWRMSGVVPCAPRCAHLERSHCTVWSNGLMPIGSHLAHYYMPCQHSPGMCVAYRCTIMCAAPEANIGSQCVHLCVCVPMPGESEGVIREHMWHCAALHSAICFGMPLELLESADCAQVQRHLAEGALVVLKWA